MDKKIRCTKTPKYENEKKRTIASGTTQKQVESEKV